MTSEQRRRIVQLASATALVALSIGCAHGASNRVDPSLRGATAIDRQLQGGAASPRLDHLIPVRDSQGSLPTRFEWTAVPGATSYSIGVWNEVDMMIWRHDKIETNSFVPTDLRLEPGTYFQIAVVLAIARAGFQALAAHLTASVVARSVTRVSPTSYRGAVTCTSSVMLVAWTTPGSQ